MVSQHIESQFGKIAAEILEAVRGAAREIELAELQQALAAAGSSANASDLLDAASAAGLVGKMTVLRCPVKTCNRVLSNDETAARVCPYCDTDLCELGEEPAAGFVYRGRLATTRDIAWLIAVHGMNTLGPWQEELSWRIANKLKYHAPVLIYKYGLIRFSVLLRWRHYMLVRDLGARIRQAMAHARRNEIQEKPDVVLHSFGTQLFRLLLDMQEFKDLSFGRVITTGSIIRPDFRWQEMIMAGRVEALLNHCGGKDIPVMLAQFCIPGTGPSGRRGFSDTQAVNVFSPAYGHSSIFEIESADANLERSDGVWYRFLTLPAEELPQLANLSLARWRPQPFLLRALSHAVVWVLILIIFGIGVAIIAFGAADVIRLL